MPPAVLLRVPAVPPLAGTGRVLAQGRALPAVRWLPPDLPPPAPFDPDRPWAPAADFPFPADPAHGVQRGLFDESE